MNAPNDILPSSDDPKFIELLAGKALGNLDHEEELYVASVLETGAYASEFAEIERTAAALAIATLRPNAQQTFSPLLRAMIIDSGAKHVGANKGSIVTLRAKDSKMKGTEASHGETQLTTTNVSNPAAIGWRESIAWLACAASLAIAALLWSNADRRGVERQLSFAEQRERLLSSASDVIRVDWSAGKTPFEKQVRGDVVWSNSSQKGFMHFEGMPINDATKEQYQLWIIDPARDDEPIDGGVFDVTSTGECFVPINAKLQVLSPAAFAITVEKPGGVVVSTQERLPLIAAVNTN